MNTTESSIVSSMSNPTPAEGLKRYQRRFSMRTETKRRHAAYRKLLAKTIVSP